MTETIGQHLKEARRSRSLSQEQAANATHIRLHYLKALEEGDFSALPSLAQARGFLRAYAGYLGLDASKLLEELGAEYPTWSAPALSDRESKKTEVTSELADSIFAEVGQKLRQHRELLGLSFEDVERHTHLRDHYLQALESGNLKNLPSPVQGRGMLNNYANFLGMDPEPLLLRFAEGLQARLASQQATRPQPRSARSARPQARISFLQRLLSMEFLGVGAVILFLGGFIIWGALRVSAIRNQDVNGTATSTSPSIAEVLLSTQVPTILPAPPASPTAGGLLLPGSSDSQSTSPDLPGTISAAQGITTTISAAIPATSGNAPVDVYLVVRQRTWVRVLVDGKTAFEGRMLPGRAYTFQGKDRIELLTGNGAALQVFFNQADIGILGSLGEVVERVFTPLGILTPTATLTFTPLPGSQVTPTATPFPGLSATATR